MPTIWLHFSHKGCTLFFVEERLSNVPFISCNVKTKSTKITKNSPSNFFTLGNLSITKLFKNLQHLQYVVLHTEIFQHTCNTYIDSKSKRKVSSCRQCRPSETLGCLDTTIKEELPASVKSTKVQCNDHTTMQDHLEPMYITCLFHHKHGTIC